MWAILVCAALRGHAHERRRAKQSGGKSLVKTLSRLAASPFDSRTLGHACAPTWACSQAINRV